MKNACIAEIGGLHRFFVDWITGALPKTDPALARLGDALAADFTVVFPSGTALARAALIDEIAAAHGRRAAGTFEIGIENCAGRDLADGLCLVGYEEWQRLEGAETRRISSALFGRREGAPNGVEWLHLHETWAAGQGPAG